MTPGSEAYQALATELWWQLGGDPAALSGLQIAGNETWLPSVYPVTRLATCAVAVACLAVADVCGVRGGRPTPKVKIDTALASASFASEQLLMPLGWEVPALWNEIGGNYRARDAWIRLHTNYSSHRLAALKVLNINADRADRSLIKTAVASWDAAKLEDEIIGSGGCAAVMHSPQEWEIHPHGRFAVSEPPISLGGTKGTPQVNSQFRRAKAEQPLAGVRVLDMTRVIAGPIATRFLAAYGADVLRIDPPGFTEMATLVPYTTTGKRCAALDLENTRDRERFEQLVAGANVLVHGLRPGAMAKLGYSQRELEEVNPALIVATHDAYGWTGPWAGQRGFDSLVQMSCGIAAESARQTNAEAPLPLPVQALDYATGYLIAAAICEGVAKLLRSGMVSFVRGSLIGVANLLMRLHHESDQEDPIPWPLDVFEEVPTSWGPLRMVRCPDGISGVSPHWSVRAGPIRRHAARWLAPGESEIA